MNNWQKCNELDGNHFHSIHSSTIKPMKYFWINFQAISNLPGKMFSLDKVTVKYTFLDCSHHFDKWFFSLGLGRCLGLEGFIVHLLFFISEVERFGSKDELFTSLQYDELCPGCSGMQRIYGKGPMKKYTEQKLKSNKGISCLCFSSKHNGRLVTVTLSAPCQGCNEAR